MTVKGFADLRIRQPNLLAPLRIEPESVAHCLYDNKFTNVFALLEGITDEEKATLLKCSTAGVLYVSDVGGSFDKYQVFSKIATATEKEIVFTTTVKRIEVESLDYEVEIRTSWDGINYNSDYLYVGAGKIKRFDLSTTKIKYRKGGVNDANIKIIGFY